MRIYLSPFRSVDPNSPLPRWKPAGINLNKPNQSWPRWWQTPRREDLTVKGSFWERYEDFFDFFYMWLSLASPPESFFFFRRVFFSFICDGSRVRLNESLFRVDTEAVDDLNFIISYFSRCVTDAGIGEMTSWWMWPILPLLCASLLNESGARCARLPSAHMIGNTL